MVGGGDRLQDDGIFAGDDHKLIPGLETETLADRLRDDDLTLGRHLGGGGSCHGCWSKVLPVRFMKIRGLHHAVHANRTAFGYQVPVAGGP